MRYNIAVGNIGQRKNFCIIKTSLLILGLYILGAIGTDVPSIAAYIILLQSAYGSGG
ncbi:MAG: hypothetical protein JST63_09095 [Bacteroidetes bacterium]|nr:hypothetical protein [Bacteroidota bacterium]